MKRFVELISVVFLSVIERRLRLGKTASRGAAGFGEEHSKHVGHRCGQGLQRHHESEAGWDSRHPGGPGRFSRDTEAGRLVGHSRHAPWPRALFLLPEVESGPATGEGSDADSRRWETGRRGVDPRRGQGTPSEPRSQTRSGHERAAGGENEPPAPATKSAPRTRITNNPEAVKGCRFLESFAQYQKVSSFQEDVVRAGGNLGYIVATNRDGDVIGESYLCSEER